MKFIHDPLGFFPVSMILYWSLQGWSCPITETERWLVFGVLWAQSGACLHWHICCKRWRSEAIWAVFSAPLETQVWAVMQQCPHWGSRENIHDCYTATTQYRMGNWIITCAVPSAQYDAHIVASSSNWQLRPSHASRSYTGRWAVFRWQNDKLSKEMPCFHPPVCLVFWMLWLSSKPS